MKAILNDQKTLRTKYDARFIASFPINLAADQIDLYKWAVEMTDSNYTSYSPAHLAMDSHFEDGVLYMTNVENIGTDTIVQHYELKYHAPNHVQFYSPRSVAYIMRWFPVTVGVPWEMQIRPVTPNTSELICLVGADYPNLLVREAAWFNGLGGTFLRKHLRKEGKAFAKHIEEKFSNKRP
jgi:hypothetical protein